MSENCFLRQEATFEIITNVASFCSECYTPIQLKEFIFYDMHNYRYLCEKCQALIDESLDENCEPLDLHNHSLL